MLKRLAVVLVAGAFLVATSARGDEVRAAIDALNAKMVADFAAGDAKALAQAYTEDALMLPPDATRIVGQSAIEALWKSWIDAGIKNLTLKSTDVDSSGDLAYEVGEFTLEASFGRNLRLTEAIPLPTELAVTTWSSGSVVPTVSGD